MGLGPFARGDHPRFPVAASEWGRCSHLPCFVFAHLTRRRRCPSCWSFPRAYGELMRRHCARGIEDLSDGGFRSRAQEEARSPKNKGSLGALPRVQRCHRRGNSPRALAPKAASHEDALLPPAGRSRSLRLRRRDPGRRNIHLRRASPAPPQGSRASSSADTPVFPRRCPTRSARRSRPPTVSNTSCTTSGRRRNSAACRTSWADGSFVHWLCRAAGTPLPRLSRPRARSYPRLPGSNQRRKRSVTSEGGSSRRVRRGVRHDGRRRRGAKCLFLAEWPGGPAAVDGGGGGRWPRVLAAAVGGGGRQKTRWSLPCSCWTRAVWRRLCWPAAINVGFQRQTPISTLVIDECREPSRGGTGVESLMEWSKFATHAESLFYFA